MAARLRRSLLYVPSSSPKMLQKSLSLPTPPDTLIYDLEDSVAAPQKVQARKDLAAYLGGRTESFSKTSGAPEIAIRVNGARTSHFEQDMMAALSFSRLRTIVLPKVESIRDLKAVEAIIEEYTAGPGRFTGRGVVDIIASVESARALWDIGEIAGWHTAKARVGGLLFAAEDFCADTAIIRTKSRQELLYARSRVVHAAKTFKVQAIDMVCTHYKDPEYLLEECQDGHRLGFTGKQAIHPSQVETIQNSFVPSRREIERAAAILTQMRQANESRKGAFGLQIDGAAETEMIDEPMVRQATNTLDQAKRAGLAVPPLD